MFNRFILNIHLVDAEAGSHQDCMDNISQNISEIIQKPYIQKQHARLDPYDIKCECREAGYLENELGDPEHCWKRVVWMACCNITEDRKQKKKRKELGWSVKRSKL